MPLSNCFCVGVSLALGLSDDVPGQMRTPQTVQYGSDHVCHCASRWVFNLSPSLLDTSPARRADRSGVRDACAIVTGRDTIAVPHLKALLRLDIVSIDSGDALGEDATVRTRGLPYYNALARTQSSPHGRLNSVHVYRLTTEPLI